MPSLFTALKCTTLQEAVAKPTLSFCRQGGLVCAALRCQGQQHPGKSCQKSARKSWAATKHSACICAVCRWWGKQNRSWVISSILSMEMSAYTFESTQTRCTSNSQQPQDGDSLNLLFAFAVWLNKHEAIDDSWPRFASGSVVTWIINANF